MYGQYGVCRVGLGVGPNTDYTHLAKRYAAFGEEAARRLPGCSARCAVCLQHIPWVDISVLLSIGYKK